MPFGIDANYLLEAAQGLNKTTIVIVAFLIWQWKFAKGALASITDKIDKGFEKGDKRMNKIEKDAGVTKCQLRGQAVRLTEYKTSNGKVIDRLWAQLNALRIGK